MRLRSLAIGPALAGCALVAVTSCSTDENDADSGLTSPVSSPMAAVSAYDIVKVGSMTVDGNLSEWANITPISIADNSGRTGGVDNTAEVKLAWDDSYLYASYDVTDTELLALQTVRDNGDIHRDDHAELYVDPQGDGANMTSMTATDYQFLANVRNALGDLKGNGAGGKDETYNATSFQAVAITDGTLNATGTDVGYTVELRVSWSDLGVTPSAGHFMRVDLAVGDRDGSGVPAQTFDWAGLAIYNNPSAWKDVQLVNPAPPTPAYDIVKVPSIAIDGNTSDWAGVAAISLADDPANGRGDLNNTANVKLAWNDSYLYAAYDVTDTELLALQTVRDNGDIHRDDHAELYVDPQGDGANATSMTATDYQFLANVRNALGDLKGNGAGGKDATYNATSFQAVATTNGTLNATGTDVGYTVELRISWSDLGITPTAGHFMRVDLAVGDRDGSGVPAQTFDWAGLSIYNNPSAWKYVRLVVDNTAPDAPTGLSLTVASSSRIDASWTASPSTDIAGYRIYRSTDGAPAFLTTVSGSPYQDTALTASTTYTYQVSAVDAAQNESPKTAPQSATTGGSPLTGIPFGPFALYPIPTGDPTTDGPYTSTPLGVTPSNIVSAIDNLRERELYGVLLVTTQGHANYTTPSSPDPNSRFDFNKWKARMDSFNTTAIKQKVAAAVADGIVAGNLMVDEPNHRDWGGYFTKAKVDELAAYSKSIFPTLPAGVTVEHQWRTHELYQELDFILSQTWATTTNWSAGPAAHRDQGLAVAAANNISIAFSINLYAGDPSSSPCITPPTGSHCAMSAQDITNWATTLGRAGKGMFMWRHHPSIWDDPQRRAAIDGVAADLASRPRPGPWTRTD